MGPQCLACAPHCGQCSRAGPGRCDLGACDDGHFDESTQPIKDTNEAPVYYEQDAKPDYAENLARFDAMMAADNDETRSL